MKPDVHPDYHPVVYRDRSANFAFLTKSTVKSAPFAVAQSQLEAVISILRERGPILQARPIRHPSIAVLYTDPVHGDRAKQLFESIMRQRLEHFGMSPSFVLAVQEEENAVARGMQHLLRTKPAAILVASTTAPAGPVVRVVCVSSPTSAMAEK